MGIFEKTLQIIDEAIENAESIGRLAKWSGVAKSSLVKWAGRKCTPRLKDASALLDALGYRLCKTDGTVVDTYDDDEYVSVPVIRDPDILDPGMIPPHNIMCWCHINREYESVRGRNGDLIVIQVQDAAMSPTLPKGCQVLVDRNDREPQYGRLYLVRHPRGETVLRRLYINSHRHDAEIIFANDNPDEKHPAVYSLKRDYHGRLDDMIVGRAIWLRTPIFNR